MRDVAALQSLNPDMPLLSALSEKFGVIGVHAFAFGHDGYTAHVRNFAPLYDIPEESATGTSNAALTGYLLRHGIIAAGDSCIFLQGEAMGRPSLIHTRVQQKNGAPDICVGGPCAIVAAGDIRR
ncbi:MAG: PhzF family phenazine biosynthesis protein [Bacteroidales bacterium]|nr:PhzF family phenazine biosynthesis protein [Bacteroidales bacterium]